MVWDYVGFFCWVGIILASISCNLGEITFMALSSFYHKFFKVFFLIFFRNVVSSYSSGTGGAGVFGSLIYLALKSWVDISPDLILIICSPAPLTIGISYFLVLEGSRKRQFAKMEDEEKNFKKRYLSAKEKIQLQTVYSFEIY